MLAAPPCNGFVPISTLIELCGKIKEPEIRLTTCAYLFRGSTARPRGTARSVSIRVADFPSVDTDPIVPLLHNKCNKTKKCDYCNELIAHTHTQCKIMRISCSFQ